MLYILHGTNTKKARNEMNKLVRALSAKKPSAGVFRMDEETFDQDEFKYLLQGQGLFEKNYIVVLENILSDEEFSKVVEENILEMKNSPHVFVLLEEKIKKPLLKKLEKNSNDIKFFEEKEIKKTDKFNVFSLADALGERSGKKLWVLYQEAKINGVAQPEEIFGILFWQIKMIILSMNYNTSEEAGVSPFPFKKAKNFSRNFKKGELKEISSKLIETYHSAYTDSGDMSLELERFILEL